MKSKTMFNTRLYQGKDRVYSKVEKGISKCWLWNEAIKEYKFNYFEARKKGLLRKEDKKTFQDLKTAKGWLYNSHTTDTAKQLLTADNSPILQYVLDRWQTNYLLTKRYGTKNYYLSKINYLKPLLDKTVESIKPKVIDSWIDWLKMQSFKDTRISFDREIKFARLLFLYYKETEDYKFENPIRSYHFQSGKVKQKNLKQNILLEPDFKLFRDYLYDNPNTKIYGQLATLQYYHCLRISEAAAVYKEDIKLNLNSDENKIQFRRKIEWARKKGDQTRVDEFFKNSDSIGTKHFVLHPEAKEFIESLYNSVENGLLFHIDNLPLSYRQIQAAYDNAFKALKMPFRSTHCLRRGSATEYYNQHGSTALIQQQLGVNSIKTAQVYAKPIQKQLDEYTSTLYGNHKKSLQIAVENEGSNKL